MYSMYSRKPKNPTTARAEGSVFGTDDRQPCEGVNPIKQFNCRIDYTEHTEAALDVVVYARSPDDAEAIAKMQFLDRRSDKPTIRGVAVGEAE